MWHRIGIVLVTIILIGGCAIGVKHDYIQNSLELEATPNQVIVIGALDHRTYVLNSRKKEKFVGLSRGGFGNPFDVVTLSGNPLATDIATSIALSLRRAGVDAEVFSLKPSQSVPEASKELLSKGAHRTLLLTFTEWKGDSMWNVRFLYDFELRVFDQTGQLLVRKVERGDENLGGSDPLSPGGGEKVSERFKSLMGSLFRDPEVKPHLIDPDGTVASTTEATVTANVINAADQSTLGSGITGTYVSKITKSGSFANQYFTKQEYQELVITLKQNGNIITGTDSYNSAVIEGTLDGDNIVFTYWSPNSEIANRLELSGTWKVNPDGHTLEGKWWMGGSTDGKWDLSKID